ncbi:MAG: carboxylesterase family protein, partial [Oscillospiraceae bacterium]|nr:carboxylesterase family protein [Oscillospiraceae bacterium]
MRKNGVGFCILYGVFSLLVLALLELNKNRVIGWVIALVLLAEYFVLRRRLKSGGSRLLVFLCLAALLAADLFVTVGPVKLHPAVEGKTGGETDVITVSDGQLTGVRTADGEVEVYAGIPYAAPPVGELRWREPQDPAPWEGVL